MKQEYTYPKLQSNVMLSIFKNNFGDYGVLVLKYIYRISYEQC